MNDSTGNRNSPPGQRLQAQGFRVEQLLADTATGRVRVPNFQRPLRWRARHVIDFFDSIRRGFPVGNLLLSRDYAPAGVVKFGPIEFDSAEQHSALWVVDGQQRIMALTATLLRREVIPRSDYWSIWYDLEREEFRQLLKKEPPAGWLPLNVIANSVDLLKWIRNWPLGLEHEDLVDRALELGKAVREYEVPAYIVEGTSEEQLRLIFTRVNTAGVDMRESEIFEALYRTDEERPIRSAVSRLCDLEFGSLDKDLFLRCLRAACGTSVRASSESPDELPDHSIERTERALRRAVDAIKLSAGIPHWKLLPYRLPLIVLTAFYDLYPAEDSRIDRLVAHWIWRGALTGDHEKVSDARVDRIVKQIREATSASQAIMALLADLAPLQSNDALPNHPRHELDQPLSLGRATGKIFIIAMLAAGPRQIGATNQSMLWDVDEELDTPAVPTAGSPDQPKFYWSITKQGNLGIDTIIKLPGMKKRDILSAPPEVLDSFLLNLELIEHLNHDRIDQYRECRRILLLDWFSHFVVDRLGDRADLRPNIQSILEANV
ncbi:hypothetical protein CA51_45700 [Rosistilla oblonga]|uniref:DUF262 domain-containing protein n=1 Tax=Rosistilla oblonga TaxID=2527990 RepID=UPI00118978EC|nr:DUF262 domain-containing protein [Rosistilla oblonga]QDV14661.1 hypothetical protein CA51_45700 [Rosistilla oblonga]